MNLNTLTRDELIEKLAELEYFPELKPKLDQWLPHYIYAQDLEVVELLLASGANPNPSDDLDCYLHYLLHEYSVSRSTSGPKVLEIMEALLCAGANPNRVWSGNWRAYDYAISHNVEHIARLLEKYGATKVKREYM